MSEDDRRLLNHIVSRALERYGARMHAYCWMSNHLHFLLQAGEEPLSHPMRNIASEFARSMQAKLHTTGHHFERRYHSKLVTDDAYLLELVRYIHLNPVEAGIAVHAGDFPWSSHHVYAGSRRESWVTTEFVLAMFGGSRETAQTNYRKFVADPSAREWDSELAFADKTIPSRGPDSFTTKSAVRPLTNRGTGSLSEVIDEACRRFRIERALLVQRRRDPFLSRVRAWIAYQAVERRISTLAEVARVLERDESTLREAIARYPDDVV